MTIQRLLMFVKKQIFFLRVISIIGFGLEITVIANCVLLKEAKNNFQFSATKIL